MELSIISDGDDCTLILLSIYQRHHIRSKELVETIINTIGGVLEKLKDGYISFLIY